MGRENSLLVDYRRGKNLPDVVHVGCVFLTCWHCTGMRRTLALLPVQFPRATELPELRMGRI